eukprot:294184-Pleurochrysis_carterae.AAC.1
MQAERAAVGAEQAQVVATVLGRVRAAWRLVAVKPVIVVKATRWFLRRSLRRRSVGGRSDGVAGSGVRGH